jgi:hypothetical protein
LVESTKILLNLTENGANLLVSIAELPGTEPTSPASDESGEKQTSPEQKESEVEGQ